VTVKRSGREAEPKPRAASRWRFWRRERLGEPGRAPTSSLEERSPREHVRIEAEHPPPAIEFETLVAEITVAEIVPQEPLATKRLHEPPGLEESEPAQTAAPAREWNIWELERRAREQAGDAARDQEWAALFMHLRQFANADGVLPMQFDGLVRESFSTLIQAA
jgi:hypothetical protein